MRFFFKKFVKNRFITSLVTALRLWIHTTLSTVKNNFSAVDYTEATVEWQQWAVEDSDTVEDNEAVGDSYKLCKRPLVIMLNCWRVNESWIVDVTEFLIQKLSAAFAKSLLELVNVIIRNFIDFKIDSFKIRKNCEF